MLTLLNCLISILRTFILPPRLSLGAVEQNGKSQLHKGNEEKRERERERERERPERERERKRISEKNCACNERELFLVSIRPIV